MGCVLRVVETIFLMVKSYALSVMKNDGNENNEEKTTDESISASCERNNEPKESVSSAEKKKLLKDWSYAGHARINRGKEYAANQRRISGRNGEANANA